MDCERYRVDVLEPLIERLKILTSQGNWEQARNAITDVEEETIRRQNFRISRSTPIVEAVEHLVDSLPYSDAMASQALNLIADSNIRTVEDMLVHSYRMRNRQGVGGKMEIWLTCLLDLLHEYS